MSFITLRKFPFIVSFAESIYHEWMSNFGKGFFCIYYTIVWVFFFCLLAWWITLIDSLMLNQTWIPPWSWCIMFLKSCWTQFLNILLRIFVPVILRDITLQISVCGLFLFWSQCNSGFVTRVRKCFFCSCFLEKLM